MSTRVRLVSIMLFVSGLCALVFQTAWLREFRLIFGASTPATAAVLAIFMGGLGVGSLWLAPRVDRAANPLRLYGQLELAISAAAILSPYLVTLVRQIYFALGGQESLGVAGASLVRLLLSTLVIGLPTFLMGGTLPAAARAITAADDSSRRGVGWLYGMNTLGAVAGAVLSTFVLLEYLGTRQTVWAAAALNLLNGFAAYQISLRWGVKEPERSKEKRKSSSEPPSNDLPQSVPAEVPALSPRMIYAAAGIVGFAFFLMELVWFRMLGPILGGTTFTFGLILATGLAGIGVGGALYPLVFARRAPQARDFAFTCGWEALALALPLALGDRLALLALGLRGLQSLGFTGQVAGWTVITLIVVFPAALVSGIQFPVLVSLLGHGQRELGAQLGRAYAWNTVGAILGSLAGGFGLLPLASAIGAWILAVVLLALLALAVLLWNFRRERRAPAMLFPLTVIGGAALCLFAKGPTAAWRHSGIGAGRANAPTLWTYNNLREWQHNERRAIDWQTDGAEASVAISRGNGFAFLVNGKSDGNCLHDSATQIMFPMIGAMVHPDPRSSLVIGLGTGESAGWLAALPQMERVDVVEIEPAIAFVAAACSPLNHNVLEHPKVHIAYNDAREHVHTTRRRYDLIASEPSNPYRAGVASLYTLEFYEAAKQRLNPGGLFVQWLQGYEIDVATVRIVLATLSRVFPHVEIWEAKPDDLVLICSAEPLQYDLARLQGRLYEPVVREAVRIGWRTTKVEGVLAHFVAGPRYVQAVAAQPQVAVNTDNLNLLEYSFARTIVAGRQSAFTLLTLRDEARGLGAARPRGIEQGVDWEEQVADQHLAFLAALGDAPINPQLYSGERGKRAEALAYFAFANGRPIAPKWTAQKKSPDDLIELLALAWGYAEIGFEAKARPLIEQVRPLGQSEALILDALLLYAQNQHAAAAERLEQACLRLREDPTVVRRITERGIHLAYEIAVKDPQQAPRLAAALSQPLALMNANEHRRLTRCLVAHKAGPALAAAAMAELEPHVPWTIEMLALRAEVYAAANHPLAAAAARDLALFREQAPETRVLTPQ